MNELQNYPVYCPYCGERFSVLIDCSIAEQQYIEDCQVCCRPIEFQLALDSDGAISVTVRHEDE